ncbi:hypothetical protein HAX54_034483 [Datura stramonium]|uniref:Uncharacterized protein n=1 Tax=Datura stramonium TaxID=4076 RepID=A0ABS8SED9_DATST|nr:hypothetical protein [Datura stramonium]
MEVITASQRRAGGRSSITEHDGFLRNLYNNVTISVTIYHHETSEPKSFTLSWTKHENVLSHLFRGQLSAQSSHDELSKGKLRELS